MEKLSRIGFLCPTMAKASHTLQFTPAARLARLRQARAGGVLLHEATFSRRHPQVKLVIYGAIRTNELFVELSNSERSFVDVVPSPLAWPLMADRVFGIDVSDAMVAFDRVDRLWKRHKAELIESRRTRRRKKASPKVAHAVTSTNQEVHAKK